MEDQFESVEVLLKDNQEGQSTKGLLKKWLAEISLYENDQQFKDWKKDCEDISKLCRDAGTSKRKGRFNFLWANLESLKPSIFYQMPKVEVGRRFSDKDYVGKGASEIIERATQYCLDSYNVFEQIELIRDDYLKYDRGVAWTRYEPIIEVVQKEIPVIQGEFGYVDLAGEPVEPIQTSYLPDGTQLVALVEQEQIVKEKVITEYVHRNDFGHTKSRTWDKVDAVWKKAYMTRDELVKRWGEELGKKIPLNHCPKEVEQSEDETIKGIFLKAEIYEIWDKRNKKVVWISKAFHEGVIEHIDDPLGLENFFPCNVIFGNNDTDSLIPKPDYMQYKPLVDEYNELGYRIASITRAVKAAGVYNAVMADIIGKVKSVNAELVLEPVEAWAAHQGQGGLKGMIDMLPIEDIAKVLRYLYESKAALKQEIFEISGMSDLMRGATDPRETATAQRIKGSYANVRLFYKQKAFSEFVRDIIEVKAEIIAEHFQPEIIQQMSLSDLSPETQQLFPQCLELLRSEQIRNYRIDIETDSTLAADQEQEKQSAIEFVNAMTQAYNDMLPIISNVPQMAPAITETLLFLVRRFKAGRSVEAAIEQSLTQLTQAPQQPQQGQGQPQGVDPKIIASQNEQEARTLQAQNEAAYRQAQLSLEAQKLQSKNNIEFAKIKQKDKEIDSRIQLEAMRTGHDIGLDLGISS